MCEKPLLKAEKKNKGVFYEVFKDTKEYFNNSDIVVGNLETVFAGEDKGYTNDVYIFNTPDSFAKALSDTKIDYVTTANNHCLDKGVYGIIRTIELIEGLGIKTLGTYKDKKSKKPYELIDFEGYKVALLNYTYGTNIEDNKKFLEENETFHVNYLRSQKKDWERFQINLKPNTFRGKLSKIIRKFLNTEQRMRVKKTLGLYRPKPSSERFTENDLYEPNIKKMKSEIVQAKKDCDYVIMVLHSGSLFNNEIGKFTKKIVDIIQKEGVDAIVGHHPHIVKNTAIIEEMFVAYSIGNFSLSPSDIYIVPDNLPQYGVLLNFYFNSEGLINRTFSIIKMVENKDKSLRVVPIHKLFEELSDSEKKKLITDTTQIYNTFTNSNKIKMDVLEEYELKI